MGSHLAQPARARVDERAAVARSACSAGRARRSAVGGCIAPGAEAQSPSALDRPRHHRRLRQFVSCPHAQLSRPHVDASRALRGGDDGDSRRQAVRPMTSNQRRWIFAAVAVAIAIGVSTATLLAVDVYLHGRYERSAGFNVWGYRGDAVGKKQPDEYRVVVLGGSAAYGYGVSADEAFPAVLERLLQARTASAHFTVVNLAYNNEGAYSFKTPLQDYD